MPPRPPRPDVMGGLPRGLIGDASMSFIVSFSRRSARPISRPPGASARKAARDLTPDEAIGLMARLLAGSGDWEGHRLFALTASVLIGGLSPRFALGLDRDTVSGPNRLGQNH